MKLLDYLSRANKPWHNNNTNEILKIQNEIIYV
jgi:hypothetical protein